MKPIPKSSKHFIQSPSQQQTLEFADVLLKYLHSHDGYCTLGDKSDAEDIMQQFLVSKKVYKRAIGDLYRRRLITIHDDGIRLVVSD